MTIQKQEVDDLNAVVKVLITEEDYNENVEKALKDASKKANIKGFRQGKVPKNVVQKLFGKSIMVDEVNKVLSSTLQEFLKEETRNIIGEPLSNIEQKPIDFETQTEFEFIFDIAYSSDFSVDFNDQIVIKAYNILVEDKMLDDYIGDIRRRYSKSVPAEIIEKGDLVRGNFQQLDAEGNNLEGGIVTEAALLAFEFIKDENIKEQFIGKKAGNYVVFNPVAAFENKVEIGNLLKIDKEEVEKANSDFRFEITENTRMELPELNQEFFDLAFGPEKVKNEEEFRAEAKSIIQKEFEKSTQYKMSADIKKYLNSNIEVLLPEEFMKRLAKINNPEISDEVIEKEFPALMQETKWSLIKNKIAKQYEIEITEELVHEVAAKEIDLYYSAYGRVIPPEYINELAKNALKDESKRKVFVERAFEDLVIDTVKLHISFDYKEVSVDEFNALSKENNN